MEIRILQKEDMEEALALVWRVFCEFEAPEYTEQGITEFHIFIEYNWVCRRLDSGELHFWGAFEGGVLTGVIAMREKSHISLLFVDKAYHRQGIARQLVEMLKQAGRENGAETVTVNASRYAVEAYRRMGFSETAGETALNGITFTPMVCSLAETPQDNI